MSAPNSLTPDKLFRLISRPDTPALIDVRTDEDAAADPRLVPGARRLAAEAVATWAPAFAGRGAVVICAEGHARSEGVAAWLRSAGARALEGGHGPGARLGCRGCPRRRSRGAAPTGRRSG